MEVAVERVDEITPQEEVETTSQRTPNDAAPILASSDPGHNTTELETLRESFNSLKSELESLKASSEQGYFGMRTTGLRILQDRIEAVLEETKIGALHGRLSKAEIALTNERQRCTELETQLQEQWNSKESISTTKTRLKQSEKELSDLRRNFAELKLLSEANEAQLEVQRTNEEALKSTLHLEKLRVQELTLENKKLALEKSKEISKLKSTLEQVKSESKQAEERVRYLDKLVSKLSEKSSSKSNDLEEMSEVPDPVNLKIQPSLPDPPSVEESLTQTPNNKDQNLHNLSTEIDRLNDELVLLRQQQNQETHQSIEDQTEELKEEENMNQETSDQTEESSKWGVAELWSFITGQ